MATITLPKHFEVNDVSFDDVKKNTMGGKVVYLKYKGQSKIVIQTPKLSAPFGISTFTDDNTGVTKHSLDVSFKGVDDDAKIKLFNDKLHAMDTHFINEGVKNSKEWFGKAMKYDVVEALYRPIVKQSKDPEKYAPTMKFKIPSKDDRLIVEAFDDARNSFDLANFAPGSKVQAIIECSSIWFVNKQFGITWKLLQVKVSKPEKLAGFSFVHDEDDDEEEEDDATEVEQVRDNEDDDIVNMECDKTEQDEIDED
jgi:hypothetical protein